QRHPHRRRHRNRPAISRGPTHRRTSSRSKPRRAWQGRTPLHRPRPPRTRLPSRENDPRRTRRPHVHQEIIVFRIATTPRENHVLSEPPTPLLPEEGWPKAGVVGV